MFRRALYAHTPDDEGEGEVHEASVAAVVLRGVAIDQLLLA